MIIYKFFVAIVWNDSVRNRIFIQAEDSGSERHGNGGYALITCERQVKDWKAFAEKRTHAQRRNKSGARGSNLRWGGWASAVAWSAHTRHFFVRQRALAFQTRTLFKQAGVAREEKMEKFLFKATFNIQLRLEMKIISLSVKNIHPTEHEWLFWRWPPRKYLFV